jgi:hypothetical protein
VGTAVLEAGVQAPPPVIPPPDVLPPPDKVKAAFAKVVSKATTLKKVRPSYAKATRDERQRIWSDDALMAQAKAALSTAEWVLMMAELGVYRPAGTVAHTSAPLADVKIREVMGTYVTKAVKAGRQVEGSVMVLTGQDWLDAYYHEFAHEAPHGGATDEEYMTNAFTTTGDPKNIIVLNKDKGNPGTTIHEGMHLYQHDVVNSKCGFNFNEGLTELLTRKVTVPMGVVRDNYDDQHDAMVEVKKAVGEKALAEAYFDGKLSALKAAFVKYRVTKGDSKKDAAAQWDNLVAHFRAEEYVEAKALCN